MAYTKLDPSSYMFRKLKEMFPKEDTFYSRYEDGDYYNTAKTFYYNSEQKELTVENHVTSDEKGLFYL